VAGGLHGVGVSVVNALSEWLELEVRLGGKIWRQRFQRGEPAIPLREEGETGDTGTKITFRPDAEIFKQGTEFSFDTLSQRLRELAFLNAGVRIAIRDERSGKEHDFRFEGGITSFVEHLSRARTPLHARPYACRERKAFPAKRAASRYPLKSRCNTTIPTTKMCFPSQTISTQWKAARIWSAFAPR